MYSATKPDLGIIAGSKCIERERRKVYPCFFPLGFIIFLFSKGEKEIVKKRKTSKIVMVCLIEIVRPKFKDVDSGPGWTEPS